MVKFNIDFGLDEFCRILVIVWMSVVH